MKNILALLTIFVLTLSVNAQQKISSLPEATAIYNTDIFPIVQSGTTKQISYSIFKTDSNIFATRHYVDSSISAIGVDTSTLATKYYVDSAITANKKASPYCTTVAFGFYQPDIPGAPVVHELYNEFTGVTFTWDRTVGGVYTCIADSAVFAENKTYGMIHPSISGLVIPNYSWEGSSQISITIIYNGTPDDGPHFSAANELLIVIEVYP